LTSSVESLALIWGAIWQLLHPVSAFIEENNVDGPMKPMVEALAKAFGALQLSTATVAQRAMKDPEAGAASTDYLRLLGLVAMGYCFAKPKIAGISAVLRNGGQALRRQDQDGDILLRADPAAGDGAFPVDQGRQEVADGAGG
jgi:hypothetical protein